MNPALRITLACLPALIVAVAAACLGKQVVLGGALAALPIVIGASLLVGRAHGVRAGLIASLSALAARLVGAIVAGIVLTFAYAADAPAAIAVLGLCLVGGLVADTWAAWRNASTDREPLHA